MSRIEVAEKVPEDSLQQLSYRIEALDRQQKAHPGVSDILAVAPQLSAEDAQQLLDKEQDGSRSTYFTGPGVCVHGAYHVYSLRFMVECPTLYRVGAFRHPHSLGPASSKKAAFHGYEAAVDWSSVNIGEGRELYRDDWAAIIQARVRIEPDASLAVSIALAAYVVIDTTELAGVPYTEPFSELLDDEIQLVADKKHICDEMHGGQTVVTAAFCGLCGGGIVGHDCTHCHKVWKLAPTSTTYPLPKFVANWLQLHGHTWQRDPRAARLQEHLEWCHAMSRQVGIATATTDNRPRRRIEIER